MAGREETIERIRKLLSMTEDAGCTQAEAVQAALLAQKLIVENDVQDFEVHGRMANEPVEEVCSRACKRMREWGKALSQTVAGAFRCKSYEGAPAWGARYRLPYFMGHATDARAAQLVFDRLYAVGNRLAVKEGERRRDAWRKAEAESGAPAWWIAEQGREEGRRGYDSFARGFLEGVRAELSKQTVALLVTVPSDVKEEFGKKKLACRRLNFRGAASGGSYERGRDAGRDAVRAGRVGEGGARLLGA